MKLPQTILLLIVALVVIGTSQSLFIVDEREQAIVLQLGQPVGEIKGPGLHFKLPMVQDVRRFDRRILSVDPRPEQMVIASSKLVIHDPQGGEPIEEDVDTSGEPIIVDTFARYKITDPLKFMKTLRTVGAANQRLESIMNDSTRGELGSRSLKELLSTERNSIMNNITRRVNEKIRDDALGIEIIDIRIVRADLTPDLRQSTVKRMISELRKRATETRAKGEEKALEIRSTAEKDRTVIISHANRDSQKLRGEGDNESIKIYTTAFNKDVEFYDFIRSMEAYKNALATPDTRMILSPDSEFFKYLSNSANK